MKILREVEQLFAQQDDLTEIAEIKSLIAEIEAHVDSTCLDAKEVVKAYTKRVAIKAGVDTEMANSRTAYALSLYAKISNIAWDYKAPAGKLAGTIGNEESKRIKHFDIDTRSKTSFEVANTLWDMIGEGVSN